MTTILLVDDQQEDLTAISVALTKEMKKCGISSTSMQVKTYLLNVEDVDNTKLDKLVKNVMTYCDQDGTADNRVLLVIDLVLTKREAFSSEELRVALLSGIMLRRYIDKNLKECCLDKDSKGESCKHKNYADKVKYLFMSSYLNTKTQLRMYIEKKKKKDGLIGIVKPRITSQIDSPEDAICIETESSIPSNDRINRSVSTSLAHYEEIQELYNKNTVYGDFIATILKMALGENN